MRPEFNPLTSRGGISDWGVCVCVCVCLCNSSDFKAKTGILLYNKTLKGKILLQSELKVLQLYML
jgi:hypothetical protein